MAQEKQAIILPDFLTVRELAELIKANPIDVMKRLISNGVMASINQQVDYDTAAIVVADYGLEAVSKTALKQQEEEDKRVARVVEKYEAVLSGEKRENLQTRSPVVTILGHVDHGKTTLLDTIRSANVAQGEAGGITQHIGAYRVKHEGRPITFLDTPGHEAFTQMRARGAQGADIAVLVVAADDGIMPTTREALNHARAANVPIIVAITKIDKNNANVERVRQQVSELGLMPQEWGGDTFVVAVSAHKKQGVTDLLEAILLVSDERNFLANPKSAPRGVVLESRMDKHKGTLATVLVLNGTLRPGDVLIAGTSYGRVKAMYDEKGKQLKEAGPSVPVSIMGLNEPPQPGERFETVKNDREARVIVEDRLLTAKQAIQQPSRAFSLEDAFARFQSGHPKELNIILKVDVQGSLQPIVDSLQQLSEKNAEGIKIRILNSDVGDISESDVMLASASSAIVIGFNVETNSAARSSAASHSVEIRYYNIIYKLLEDMELALAGMLQPQYELRQIGMGEVRQLFRISKVGVVAGCYIREGEVRRNAKVRVRRAGQVIAENLAVGALKRFNEDVKEVRTGFECGVSLDGFNEYEEGDLLEFLVQERVN